MTGPIDALLAHLGVPVPPGDDMERWAVRVAAAAGAEGLVDAVHEPGLRRIAAFVLRYSDSPPPEIEVDDPPTRLALHIARGVHFGWSDGDDLTRFGTAFGALLRSRAEPGMLGALLLCTGEPGAVLAELPWAEPGWDTPVRAVDDLLHRVPHPHVEWLRAMAPNPLLADSAARTRDPSLVEPYGIALLHDEDAVAALLDSDLADEAADKLAWLRDERCLPRLTERVRTVRGLAVDTDDAQWALVAVCHQVSMTRRASPEMLTRLRVLAGEHPVRVRQYAQIALLELGDTDWLVPVLVRELTEHPVRTGAEGPHNGNYGWRADATACAWLGRIGPAAAAAVPVLRSMLAESALPGEARPEAAEAYWRITGDATTALSTLDSLRDGDLGVRARAAAARVRA